MWEMSWQAIVILVSLGIAFGDWKVRCPHLRRACGARTTEECGGSDQSQEAIGRGEKPSSGVYLGRETLGC